MSDPQKPTPNAEFLVASSETTDASEMLQSPVALAAGDVGPDSLLTSVSSTSSQSLYRATDVGREWNPEAIDFFVAQLRPVIERELAALKMNP